jgi:hypothetical protein
MRPRRVEAHTAAVRELRVGDHVKIVRRIESLEGGWHNSWASDMDNFVNNRKVYRVREIVENDVGVHLSGEKGATFWSWPATALEKVSISDPVVKTLGCACTTVSLR